MIIIYGAVLGILGMISMINELWKDVANSI